jgi:ACS family hexuronate transporter-like MFS transporter
MHEGRTYGASIDTRRGTDSLSLSLMLFMAMNSMSMSLMPIVGTDLEEQFSFSASRIGFLTSIFMVTFAIGAIPMGLAGARWGGRTIIAGAGLYALGSVLFAFSASYPWFLAARFLQGVGSSTVIPVSNPLMAQMIGPRYQARALGVFGTGHGLGVVAALLILPSIQEAGGYRAVFLTAAGIAVVIALAATAQKAIRAKPRKAERAVSFAALMRGVGTVAVNRRLLLLVLVNIGVMAIVVGVLAWTPSFLHDQRGARLAVAAYLTAGIGVAQMVGNIAGAAAMARWGKPLVLLAGMAVMFAATALVPVVPGAALAIACVVIAGLMTMVVFPAIFGSVPDVVARPEQVGPATGFLNLTNLVGTLFAPWLFGVLLDVYGTSPGTSGYLSGYLLLALFPFLGTIAAAIYLAGRKRPAAKGAL